MENPNHDTSGPNLSTNLPVPDGAIGGNGEDNTTIGDNGDLGEGAHMATDDAEPFSEEDSLDESNQQISDHDPNGFTSLPILNGGTGGSGGGSQNKGGAGGRGEGARISIDLVRLFYAINGGCGGTGGPGGEEGGMGGVGQGPTILVGLLSEEGRKLSRSDRLPILSLDDFCQKYHLSGKIRSLLDEYGFETPGAIFEASHTDLGVAGWKLGQIAELRRALQVFVYKSQEPDLVDSPIGNY
ncbi:hypothetical protein C8R45DRAFT_1009619 [Mycena sanguinolenta]|nr:hypothetical protein C8R45DRAFT_1009619 [Mycena sanguinolenta]